MHIRARLASVSFAALVLIAPAVARAGDKAAAEAAFEAGKQLMVDGRFAEACPKLEESLRLEAGVGTMLYLAACYENTGRTASAWAEFREAQALAARLGDGRAQVARARADRLEPRLARLTIVVPPALRGLPGLTVHRDDVDVGPGVFDTPIAVDPGAHRVVVSATGKKAWRTEVQVAAEDARASVQAPAALEDEPNAIVSSTPPPPGETPPPSGALGPQRIAAIAVGGAGVVALGVSMGFGLAAKSKNDDSNADDHCRGNLCDEVGTEARNAARDRATVSTVFFFVGLAAVGGGAALWFTAPAATSPSARVVPAVGPGHAGLRVSGVF